MKKIPNGLFLLFLCSFFSPLYALDGAVSGADSAIADKINTASVAESGVTFPPSTAIRGKTLVLNGTGTRKATIFSIKVYAAALYNSIKTNDPSLLLESKTPLYLSMVFLRDLGKEKLQDAWRDGLKKNNPTVFESLSPSLEKLNRSMFDVKKEDRFLFTFLPGEGVQFSSPGRGADLILSDPSFVRPLLKVWLGEHPPDDGIKEGLLGK